MAFLAVLVVQIIFGAFMAGTTGYLYQTFSLMNGEFFPTWDEYFSAALGITENLSILVCPSHAWLVCTLRRTDSWLLGLCEG